MHFMYNAIPTLIPTTTDVADSVAVSAYSTYMAQQAHCAKGLQAPPFSKCSLMCVGCKSPPGSQSQVHRGNPIRHSSSSLLPLRLLILGRLGAPVLHRDQQPGRRPTWNSEAGPAAKHDQYLPAKPPVPNLK